MKVILHIGQQKTGSKSLQACLYRSREVLSQHGILFPVLCDDKPLKAWQLSHHELFRRLREQAVGSNGADAGRRALDDFLDGLAPNGDASTLVLSSEDLFEMCTSHDTGFSLDAVSRGAALLAAAFESRGWSVRVVCYLRRQDHLAAARYAQWIKGPSGGRESFDEFLDRWLPRFDFDAILSCWERAFGWSAISVLPYERARMAEGVAGDFFPRFLGVRCATDGGSFAGDPEAVNATPDRDHVEFIRRMNQRGAQGLAVLPREAVLQHAFDEREVVAPAPGIREWMSPAARRRFLERFEAGNRAIASRYGFGNDLFAEPLPDAEESWTEWRGADPGRLLSIDAGARRAAASMRAGKGKRGRTEQVAIVLDRAPAPDDARLAARVVGEVTGLASLEPFSPRSLWERWRALLRRPRAWVMVGYGATLPLTLPGLSTTRCVMALSRLPANRREERVLRASARRCQAIICPDTDVLRALAQRLPPSFPCILALPGELARILSGRVPGSFSNG